MPFTEPTSPRGTAKHDYAMKSVFRIFPLLTVFLFLSQTVAAQDSTALKQQQTKIQTEILEYLNDQGFRPVIDKDGDIQFKASGDKFFIIVTSHFTTLKSSGIGTKIVFSSKWSLPTDDPSILDLNKAIIACNKINAQLFVTKAFLSSDNALQFTVETWIQHGSDFTCHFFNYLVGLQAAQKTVFDEIE